MVQGESILHSIEIYQEVYERGIVDVELKREFGGMPTRRCHDCTFPLLWGEKGETAELDMHMDRNKAYHLLQECERRQDLPYGRLLQSLMVHYGLISISILSDHLIRLFIYHGFLVDANTIFPQIDKPSAYTWAAIILANAKLGQDHMAIEFLHVMRLLSGKKDKYIYAAALKACASSRDLSQGRIIHEDIIKSGLETEVSVGSTLVHMYARCCSLKEAVVAFERIPNLNTVSWSTMVAAYVRLGKSSQALEIFEKMQMEGLKPDEVTFLSVLNASASLGGLEQGRLIHEKMMTTGIQLGCIMGNALVDMYAKCGSLFEACKVFHSLSNRSVVSWGAVIAGYVQHERASFALDCFEQMQAHGMQPNQAIFCSILKACANIRAINHGRFIHNKILESGYQLDITVTTALVDMYAKCGSLEDAFKAFNILPQRDIISWGAMITAYAQLGESFFAITCFNRMKQEGMKPNEVTFLGALKACSNLKILMQGRLMHEEIFECGLTSSIVANSLIDMYARCGSLRESFTIFDKSLNRDVVSWNAMILGYAQHGEGILVRDWFVKMQQQGIVPNFVTFLCMLKSCASIGALQQGRNIHKEIMNNETMNNELQSDIVVGSALVDMYAKCGSIGEAHEIFSCCLNQNIILWSIMIAGYAQHGEAHLALECFEKMQKEGIEPNEVVLTSILVAYNYAGLADEGRRCFKCMKEAYGILPDNSHSICMVDLLSRSGFLNEAEHLIQDTMPTDAIGWMTLLSACRMHGNSEVGRQCLEHIVHLDGYAIMSDLYSDVSKWKVPDI